MNDTTKENKMGVMPIPKLLITMSLPMVISMLVQALYNIIDSVFVAQINEEALTAVSLAFPVQNLMIAIATGTGVGINALLSRNLGEKRFKEANLAARNGIFLGVLSCIVIALLGLFGSHAFLSCRLTIQRSSHTERSIYRSLPSPLSVFSLRSRWNACFRQPGRRSIQ